MSTHEAEVHSWAAKLLGGSINISSLAGGANNHLFRCRSPNGDVVIKRYRDQNFGAEVSRRQAEIRFLQHASIVAPDFVPKLIAVHDQEDMIAMSLVRGDPYSDGVAIPEPDIEAAMSFYRRLNESRELVRAYPVGAREGYLSISEHLTHVEHRLTSLSVVHLPDELRQDAQSVVNNVLRCFTAVRDGLLQLIHAGDLNDTLPRECVQLSPGDFGFHNALRAPERPIFLDFEYAGLDDPAKTLADFFLQPRLPVDPIHLDKVVEGMAVTMSAKELRTRSAALRRVLAVKWMAIILSPLDEFRFAFFAARYGKDFPTQLAKRLQRANALSRLG